MAPEGPQNRLEGRQTTCPRLTVSVALAVSSLSFCTKSFTQSDIIKAFSVFFFSSGQQTWGRYPAYPHTTELSNECGHELVPVLTGLRGSLEDIRPMQAAQILWFPDPSISFQQSHAPWCQAASA